ncbi:SpaA isopeptide-forming pilin-related protein [Gudongella oleilytica]|uniref:SpaA isopeptide-forming pilin-related protein n=1 Tax=Gudongella oleilytica TaxID=1582259 RepID=UPI002A35B992|nr:SpaA isopeptide-forming pilin-related protein [Gudongella oleilytica]MDY0255872.1 SpaA isopeptide-forming pilin-related protein [Gudongella oleilytica]
MKKGKLKIILLILAMTLSTFASGLTWEDFEGNDEFSFKVDPPKSTTFYFDEEGEKVTGPTDFWVKFVVSGDEISFTTKNIELDILSVKGGPNYRVYYDVGSSGSGFTAPINPNNDEPYGISHYSFEFTIIPPPPPPDPEGSIKITKIVVDEEEEVIPNDNTKFFFKVEFWSEEEWVELEDSPFEIIGNGSKTLSKLPMGEYKITEVDVDEDYELITENGIEVELVKDGDNEETKFTNMKEGETPPPDPEGSIKITKIVVDEEEEVIPNDNTKFFFKVEFWSEEEWVELEDSPFEIIGNGSKTLSKLPMGEYKITEVDIDEDYELITENGIEVELVKDGDKEEVEFTNMKEGETPPPPGWTGIIRIIKSVDDPRNSNPSLTGFEFTLFKVLEGDDELIGARTTGSTGIVSFSGLEEGEYRLFETDRSGYREGIPSAGRLITLEPENTEDDILTVEVENERVYPPPRDDDDEDEDEPEEPDEPEQVLETTVVEEEPVPEAPPIVEVVEEVIPLATLPKTGASDATLFSGLGAAMLGLGLLIKKRR